MAAMRRGDGRQRQQRHEHRHAEADESLHGAQPTRRRALRLIGVEIDDLGAPAHATFRRADGRLRADVRLPDDVIAEYGGGFIGLLRPGLYKRMLDALPAGVLRTNHAMTAFEQHDDHVTVRFAAQEPVEVDVLVGADGISSAVRRGLWGEQPIRHQRLHLVGGYLFTSGDTPTETVVAHNRTTQASYSGIRHEGKPGYEWWVLEGVDPSKPFAEDLKAFALRRARGFAGPIASLIAQTPREHLQRWEIRDRKPLKQWSQGRVTLVGDAAHPTSPYAAYGAGMSIEDGYFLAAELATADPRDPTQVRRALQAYEDRRKPHTSKVSQQAYWTGRVFHHLPRPLQPLRDLIYDHTPLLQKIVGDDTPAHILRQLQEIDAVEPAPLYDQRDDLPTQHVDQPAVGQLERRDDG
jgi:2-polyprenyl-6-methoxyphenol hydroxylase-like FAD-dependent oxidoreductase